MSCNPIDVTADIEKKKEKILSGLKRSSSGFDGFLNVLTSGGVDSLVNIVTDVMGSSLTNIVDTLVKKNKINEIISTVGTFALTTLTIMEHAKAFWFGLYVESLRQSLSKRIEIATKIDKYIIDLLRFLNVWGYDAATAQWGRLNNAYGFMKRVDKDLNITKKDLEFSGLLNGPRYRKAYKNVVKAENSYVTTKGDVNLENAPEVIAREFRERFEDISNKYEKYVAGLNNIFKLLPLDRALISKFSSGLYEIGVYIAASGISGKDFKDIFTGLFGGETLKSTNQTIRATISELRNFDLNYDSLKKKNQSWVLKTVEHLYETSHDIVIAMESDLTLNKNANLKLAAKNIGHLGEIRKLRALFEMNESLTEGTIALQREYNSLGDLISAVDLYPDEHPLEIAIDSFITSLSLTIDGIWDDYGSQRAVVELNNIRRLITRGISLDSTLLALCKKFDVINLPLEGILKDTPSYLSKKSDVVKLKNKFDQVLEESKTFFAQTEELSLLNAFTGTITLSGLNDTLDLIAEDECDEKTAAAQLVAASKYDNPVISFEKMGKRFIDGLDKDKEKINAGWDYLFPEDSGNTHRNRVTE